MLCLQAACQLINLTNMKKLIITILIISAVILSGCLAKPQTNQNTNQSVNQNVNSSNENINVNTDASSTFVDIGSSSDFKIYKNKMYGFQFEVPKSWNIQEVQDSSLDNTHISVRFFDNNKTYEYRLFVGIIKNVNVASIDFTSIDKFKQWHAINMISNYIKAVSISNINQYSVVKTEENDGIDSMGRYYYFSHGNLVIYFRSAKDNDEVSSGILSSFSFIE